jgi:hypothetical protein
MFSTPINLEDLLVPGERVLSPQESEIQFVWEKKLKIVPFVSGWWGVKDRGQFYCYFGSPKGHEKFESLAKAAGGCLAKLPQELIPKYPLLRKRKPWPNEGHMGHIWMNEVYRLAFQHPTSPLCVKRHHWVSKSIGIKGYDPEQMITLQTKDPRYLKDFEPALKRYRTIPLPSFLAVSLCLDVFLSSSLAAEFVITQLAEYKSKPASLKGGFVFSEEARTLRYNKGEPVNLSNGEVAVLEALIKAFPDPWRPYDKKGKIIKASPCADVSSEYNQAKSRINSLRNKIRTAVGKSSMDPKSVVATQGKGEGWLLKRKVSVIPKK